jgi:hypothetical protein
VIYFKEENMPIILPDFKNTHFCWMTISGGVLDVGKELNKWMKAEKARVSTLKFPKGNRHIRLMLVGGSENHVQIDISAAESAPKDVVGKLEVTPLNTIQESLGRLSGKVIDTNIAAGFRASFNELPDPGLIRSMFFKTNIGKVAIKSNGAKLLIEGAPVRELTWYAPDEKHIHITLETEPAKKIMSDDYLINASISMEQAFNVFVLGKAQNE